MSIGERIKFIRKELGLTQEEFGNRIGLVASMICLLENGTAKYTERTLKSICNEYGINREWLENGNGEMRISDCAKETLSHEFSDIICAYPSLYETAKMVSKHMTQSDWKRVNELLREMGGC